MVESAILQKYNRRVKVAGTLLCVGLDSELEKIPARFATAKYPQYEFNRWIIDETVEHASAFKPNMAFYEALGSRGLDELRMTMEYLRSTYPDVVTVCDAKRADIGNTNRGYVVSIFDELGFDSITLHPYLGREALVPFLERADKASIILCRTSNSGSGEFQDLEVGGHPMWQIVAEKVESTWNAKGNCMLVVGATYPAEMKKIREVAPGLTFLVPGIGAQGGDVSATVAAGLDMAGGGMMINSSRGIIFSDNPAKAARELRNEINAAREVVYASR